MEGNLANRAFLNRIQFHNRRKTTDFEKEIRKAIKASITEVDISDITDLLADLLSKDEHFVKEYTQYKDRTNHPQQTDKL